MFISVLVYFYLLYVLKSLSQYAQASFDEKEAKV